MVNFKNIFEDKQKFKMVDSFIQEEYQYQSNEDKGEFINQEGQVVAQLIDANPNNEWFAVAGIFMGQITLKAIQYKSIIIESPINASKDTLAPFSLSFEA
jgi:hypothetical protein